MSHIMVTLNKTNTSLTISRNEIELSCPEANISKFFIHQHLFSFAERSAKAEM